MMYKVYYYVYDLSNFKNNHVNYAKRPTIDIIE